jgi:Protein-L-isoaspartate(D-aspartate) O-methyltransferase (PCMT)
LRPAKWASIGRQAKQRLRRQVRARPVRQGDRAGPDLILPPLIQQLKAGSKLVIPAGLPDAQTLILVEKPSNGGVMTKEILPVRFSQLEGAEAA